MEPELEAGTYRPYLVCEQTIAPDATAIVWIDDAVQTLDIGGSSEAHFRMVTLDPLEIGGDATVEVSYEGANDRSAKTDALVLQPAIEYRVVEADDGIGTVLRSFVEEPRRETVSMPIRADWDVEVRCFDETGEMVRKTADPFEGDSNCDVPIEPRGFSIARAGPTDSASEDD